MRAGTISPFSRKCGNNPRASNSAHASFWTSHTSQWRNKKTVIFLLFGFETKSLKKIWLIYTHTFNNSSVGPQRVQHQGCAILDFLPISDVMIFSNLLWPVADTDTDTCTHSFFHLLLRTWSLLSSGKKKQKKNISVPPLNLMAHLKTQSYKAFQNDHIDRAE